jgi:hypothetical protein
LIFLINRFLEYSFKEILAYRKIWAFAREGRRGEDVKH